jgi:hypothetical protein
MQKIAYKFIVSFIVLIFVSACSEKTCCPYKPEPDGIQIVYGIAQLGRLANAKVNIYRLTNDGAWQLLWEETTSSSDQLEEIGLFDSHQRELKDEKYYIYEVIGGEDWDTNDDNIIDNKPTQNKGTLRLIALGKI